MEFFIEGLLNTGTNVSIITLESWHMNWPLQEIDVQFPGIGTLFAVQQSTRWVECIGPEGQIGRLRPYIANIAMNLWGCDLLQQWNTQMNIPATPKTYVSEENIRKYNRGQTPAIQAVQEHKAIDKPSEVQQPYL